MAEEYSFMQRLAEVCEQPLGNGPRANVVKVLEDEFQETVCKDFVLNAECRRNPHAYILSEIVVRAISDLSRFRRPRYAPTEEEFRLAAHCIVSDLRYADGEIWRDDVRKAFSVLSPLPEENDELAKRLNESEFRNIDLLPGDYLEEEWTSYKASLFKQLVAAMDVPIGS